MRVYSIKYTKDVEVPLNYPIDLSTITKGPFVKKAGEYEPRLFKTKGEAKESSEKLARDKGFEKSACEVVSMYIDESEAIFHLYSIAFEIFPDFRKCAVETPQDLT